MNGEAERETALSAAIGMSAARASYDAHAKRLIAYREVFARILKGCVPGFGGLDVATIRDVCLKEPPQIGTVPVEPGMSQERGRRDAASARERSLDTIALRNGEDAVPGEGTVFFDVMGEAFAPGRGEGGDSEATKVYVNVEAQGGGQPGRRIVSRAQFYAAREMSRQYGVEFTSPHYELLKRACTVWLLFDPPEELRGRVVIAGFRWSEEGVPIAAPRWTGEADLMTVALVGLTDEAGYTGIARMLGVLFSKTMGPAVKKAVLRDEFGLEMTRSMEEGEADMGSIADWLVSSTRREAIEEGRQEGLLMAVRNLMKKTGSSADEAMDTLGVPEDVRPTIEDGLNKHAVGELIAG